MKIKNLFSSILAIASMLLVVSCSQDDILNTPTSDEYVDATFTIATADGIGTRAIGDGTTVDKVACAVYDAFNGEELTALRKDVVISNKTAVYSVRLAKGKNYRVAFFAYKEAAAAYNVTDLKNITLNDNKLSNVEGRDAFTAFVNVEEGETMNTFTKKVTLKRPFAQLNLGIDDTEFQEAKNAGLEVAKSKIVVSNVYSAFNAYTNGVVGDAESMTFGLNDIPREDLIVEGSEYNYLALNYLLVGDSDTEKTLTDVEFTWESTNGDSNAESVTSFLNIPVQRNYRTNIVGKLLTSPSTFEIRIDAGFAEGGEIKDFRVFNAKELQDALVAASQDETTIIKFGADIVGNVTDVQGAGENVVIDGCGYKYDGSIKVHSNSNYYADAALTIKNVNFETSAAGINCIEALENGSERYSNNITVENCTFTATGDAVNTSVAVQVKATRGVTVKGCTATNMHSLIQAQSCDTGDVIVNNCTVNGKNGVAFKQVKNAVVEGTTITAVAYGIRFDGNINNYGITVKNNQVNASQPFIVRKMTGKNNTFTLEGENVLTVSTSSIADETSAYQIVITNGSDDEEYVKPTGTYTLTGADNFTIFPRPLVAKVGNAEYDSIDEAIANWTNGTTLTLLKNVTLNDVITIKSTEYHILDLGTYTMTAAKGKDAIAISTEGRTSASYALDIKADANNPGGITATSKAIVKTTGKSGVKDRPIIRFYNGVFNATNAINHSGSNGTNCPQFQFHNGVYNCNLSANRALIQIYGGTFNGKFYISVDSSAYALISGGKFKYMDNLYGSALNSDKFTIGSSKGNFDRGVYVDNDGYIVVGGAVITEFGDMFSAKATNASKAGSYLPYSSAAENGLYYTNAEMAIQKHGEANVVLK